MEIENKRKKIFISNIDSRLGYHLVQTLRNDHEQLENYIYLVGTSSKQKYPHKYHQSIHALINYDINPNLLARTILECDVIILDVREATDQVEFIIKILEQKAKRQKSKSELNSNSKICLVGIGSHMTWAHEKPSINKFQSSQKQQALSKFLNYDAKKQQKITENDRDIRLTHHSWVRERQIQKSITNLSKFSNIYSCILTTGLIYGKDFPQSSLKSVINKCFSVTESLFIYGEGENVLPTVYIEDFCGHLQKTINILEGMESNNKNLACHYISVDEKLHSQLQIIERVLKSSGYVKQIIRNPLSFMTKQQAFYSHSVPIMKSAVFNEQSLSESFCWYFDQRYDEILQHLELEWKHYVIYGQQMEAKQLQQLTQHLSTVIQVLKQQDIENRICMAKNISKQDVDIHEVGLIIEEQYLKKHDRQNYILVLTQILLNTEIVKKHNLIKFQSPLYAPMLLQHKYKQYSNVIEQVPKSEKPLSEKNKKRIKKELVQNRENDNPVIVRKQYKMIDQYLLDNVISYVAEAFVQISQKPTLPSLICALKNIYNRQLNITKKISQQIKEEKQNMI